MNQALQAVNDALISLQNSVDQKQAAIQQAIDALTAKLSTGATAEELQAVISNLQAIQADVESTSTTATPPPAVVPAKFKETDLVKIVNGDYKDQTGTVQAVNPAVDGGYSYNVKLDHALENMQDVVYINEADLEILA